MASSPSASGHHKSNGLLTSLSFVIWSDKLVQMHKILLPLCRCNRKVIWSWISSSDSITSWVRFFLRHWTLSLCLCGSTPANDIENNELNRWCLAMMVTWFDSEIGSLCCCSPYHDHQSRFSLILLRLFLAIFLSQHVFHFWDVVGRRSISDRER